VIVDSHVHVVSGDRARYPVLPGAPDWPVTEVDGLVADMDALGIDRALLVQTFFTYGTDNSYMIDAAARHPGRFQTVCVIDQMATNAPDVLTGLVEKHGVAGIRFMPKGHAKGALWHPQTFPLWRRAGELGIPITIAAELAHLPGMPAVVARFPQVRVAFEHMWALELDPPDFASIRPIFALAQFPNVYLKLCPNNSHAIRAAKTTARAFFGPLIERFGIGRMMFGSNYPAHTHRFGDLKARLRIMQEDFAGFGDEERRWFFAETALSLWPALRSAVQTAPR
jgi:predicted TIM-barrel fold metal-dependent hydrolase